jgi:hypothetical protein
MATMRRGLERLTRLVALVAVTALVALLLAVLAPFAINEQRPTGSAADTAAPLTGEAQAATDGLRGLGFSCADVDVLPETLTRVCSRVRLIEFAEVRMVVRAATGEIMVSTSLVEEAGTAQATRDRLREIIPDRGGSVGRSGAFPVTITGSIDALAAAARGRGYVCETPEIQNIRGCTRKQDGYTYRLWMQGTDRFLATLDLEVLSAYRTQTRRQWLDEMTVVVSWLGTDQGRQLSSWLAGNADAPGARGYVAGLPVYFLVRADEYTKETFGGVAPECGRIFNNISGCSP